MTFTARVKAGCFGLGFGAGLPRLCRAPGSALPPVPEQLHLREADAPGSVCLHLPYVQARLAGRVSEPAPNRSPSQPLSPLQDMLLLLTPPRGRGCRHPEAESHPPGFARAALAMGDARVRRDTATLSPVTFPLCTARAEGKANGKGMPAAPLTLAPLLSPGLVPSRQPGQDPNSSPIELHLPGSRPR